MPIQSRQLDFSPLDYRSQLYKERLHREQILANTIATLSKYISETQTEKAKARRQKQADIAEGMSFDTNLTANTVINSSIADYWNKIRDTWIQEMQAKKGPVTAMDKAKLDVQKQAVIKMAIAGKNFVKIGDDMKKLGTGANRDLYEYDWDEYQRILQDLDSGEVSLEDFAMTDFSGNYDTGMPFVNLRAIDPGPLEDVGMKKFKESTKQLGTETTIENIIGGKKVTATTQPVTYGTYQDYARDMISGINARKGDNANIMKFIMQNLSDQEKQQAIKMYPEQDIEGSYLNYYYYDKKKPELEGGLIPVKKAKRAEKVITSKEGAAAAEYSIPFKNEQWDMRGKPQKLVGKIDVAYKDGEETEVLGNRSMITRINYGTIPGTDKKMLYASVLIPKAGTDIYQRIMEGEEIPEDELFKELLSPDKSEQVYVPYEDVKNVLKRYDFENIGSYEGKKENMDMNEIYNLEGYGNYTKQELLDAGWSEEQIKALK